MTVLGQLIRFLLVGGFATALQYLILITLVQAGMAGPVVASSIGFTLSALANYALNKRFTFASPHRHRVALPRFAAVALSGLTINGAMVWLLADVAALHYVIAQIGATACTLAWNFALNRLWTFRAPAVDGPRREESVQ